MFIRVDRGRVPPAKVDEFASFMAREVTPGLRGLSGYRSTTVAVDRGSGMLSVTTDWETSADRDRCDDVLAAVLKNAHRLELEPIQIELFEVTMVDQPTKMK